MHYINEDTYMMKISDADKIAIVVIIDKIISIVPEIESKRSYIIDQILGPGSIVNDQYVLERVNINGKNYYKDKYKCLLNEKGELVGIWERNINNFNYYVFADEKEKIQNNFN